MTAIRLGVLRPEHAGEALTVQRAAYVTEAQRYAAPGIPPLTETVDALRAAVETAAPPGVVAFWLVTGERSADNLRFYRGAGYVEHGRSSDAAGVRLVRLVKPRVAVPGPPVRP